MSRVINFETAGKERIQYQRAIVLALRELLNKEEVDSGVLDLAAFLVLMLEAIDTSIDRSVLAWEKRGYWLKADRFRQEWYWAGMLGRRLREAVFNKNWDEVRLVSAQLFIKLRSVNLPARHKLGTPWVGAFEKLKQKQARSDRLT